MIVFVNTRFNDHNDFVVTLDTRSVFLLSRASTRAIYDGAGKVHWARRTGSVQTISAMCSAAVGAGYVPWTGKPSQITCARCATQWWTNERLLGAGGADFIQNGH